MLLLTISTSFSSTFICTYTMLTSIAFARCARRPTACVLGLRAAARALSTAVPTDDRPLAGIKVVDLTRVLAGPLATMMLVSRGGLEPLGTGADPCSLIWEVSARSILAARYSVT
jgi:hypothetical protein